MNNILIIDKNTYGGYFVSFNYCNNHFIYFINISNTNKYS